MNGALIPRYIREWLFYNKIKECWVQDQDLEGICEYKSQLSMKTTTFGFGPKREDVCVPCYNHIFTN